MPRDARVGAMMQNFMVQPDGDGKRSNAKAAVPGMLVSQFSASKGISAALLRYLQGNAKIEHVDVVVPAAIAKAYGHPILSRYGLLGARMDGGVQLRPPNYAQFLRKSFLGCVVPDIDGAYEFLFAQVGKPYNKGAILDFFLCRERKFSWDQSSWFCDELDFCAYWRGGKVVLNTTNPLNLTPQELFLSDDLTTQYGE
ncbi:MAG: hypothetical protein ACYDC6_12390 [Acidobacteriaceae bacterium]